MSDSTHALTGVALADPKRTVDSALEAPRELLGMEVAYFSAFADGSQPRARARTSGRSRRA